MSAMRIVLILKGPFTVYRGGVILERQTLTQRRKGRKEKRAEFFAPFAPSREMVFGLKRSVSGSSLQTKLRGRLDAVEQHLRAACGRAGRDRAAVTLVAVT